MAWYATCGCVQFEHSPIAWILLFGWARKGYLTPSSFRNLNRCCSSFERTSTSCTYEVNQARPPIKSHTRVFRASAAAGSTSMHPHHTNTTLPVEAEFGQKKPVVQNWVLSISGCWRCVFIDRGRQREAPEAVACLRNLEVVVASDAHRSGSGWQPLCRVGSEAVIECNSKTLCRGSACSACCRAAVNVHVARRAQNLRERTLLHETFHSTSSCGDMFDVDLILDCGDRWNLIPPLPLPVVTCRYRLPVAVRVTVTGRHQVMPRHADCHHYQP
jgi:hypothetical protein